jgi:hypothetical protein
MVIFQSQDERIPMTTITSAAAKILPEVVGKALYIEMTPVLDSEGKASIWQGADSIFQFIVTPNGVTPEGKAVPIRIFERIVSPRSPRSQWDSAQAEPINHDSDLIRDYENGGKVNYYSTPKIEDFDKLPAEVQRDLLANGIAQVLKRSATNIRRSYNEETKEYEASVTERWKISQKFAVEATDEDLKQIYDWKTPQAIIRRINKVRDLA